MPTRTIVLLIACLLAGPAAAAADCTSFKLSAAHPSASVVAKQVTENIHDRHLRPLFVGTGAGA